MSFLDISRGQIVDISNLKIAVLIYTAIPLLFSCRHENNEMRLLAAHWVKKMSQFLHMSLKVIAYMIRN